MSAQLKKPGWGMIKFGDITENVAVRVDPADAKTDVYVGLEHLDPSTIHLRQWGHPSDVSGQKLAFKKGDVIFGRRRAYQRKLAVAEFDGICSAHAMVVRAKPKMILPEFLPFFLQSDMFMERAIEISVGSLSPTINWKTLQVQEFPLPPLEEQKRIAEILWAADEAVEKYKESLNALTSIKSRTFRELLKHKSTVEVSCGELYSLPPRNGSSPKTNASRIGSPTLSIGAVRDGKVDPNGNTKYAEISSSDLEKFRLMAGDILVVRGNGNKNLCGKAGLVSEVPDDCFYPDLLIRITFDGNKILPAFAVAQWNDPMSHRKLLAYAQSTNGIWKINGKDLRQHKMLVPAIEVQKEIIEQLSNISAREVAISNHVEVLYGLQRQIANEVMEGAAHV
ncbi:restriction endonuclease subunit S [Thiolapillus sp.]|uniref:restriction endonuclease subunit S n=1 Tax=Thiolapillus sp. TaxID=2017437 RepID=UPI003AF771D7